MTVFSMLKELLEASPEGDYAALLEKVRTRALVVIATEARGDDLSPQEEQALVDAAKTLKEVWDICQAFAAWGAPVRRMVSLELAKPWERAYSVHTGLHGEAKKGGERMKTPEQIYDLIIHHAPDATVQDIVYMLEDGQALSSLGISDEEQESVEILHDDLSKVFKIKPARKVLELDKP